ncbi:MAG: hypothetical protein HYV60_11355 [Planctomycetia bacterium]|nr:hypothetical protein [Planctomycetia bacterium]
MELGTPFQLIDVFLKHNVPVVIIGGHAVTYHGFVRATEDVDVVGLERVFPVSLSYVRQSRLMMLTTDLGYLDIFDFIPGFPNHSVSELFDSAVETDGRKFASLAWLRKMKAATGRAKDQLDLENLPTEP